MMETMKVGIYVSNENYAKDMARWLAGRNSQISIDILDGQPRDEKQFDILISDKASFHKGLEDDQRLGLPKNLRMMRDSEGMVCVNERAPMPMHEVYAEMLDVYRNMYGISFEKKRLSKTIVYRFASMAGGSGVSAISITMARLLVCKGSKVLYINAGGSASWRLYASGCPEPLRGSDELELMIKTQTGFSLASYVQTDDYGLEILEIRRNIRKVIEYIAKLGIYDAVVVDMPEGDYTGWADSTFLVLNEKDVRRVDPGHMIDGRKHPIILRGRINFMQYKEYNPSDCDTADENMCSVDSEVMTLVRNRSYYSIAEGDAIHIADDAASFELVDGGKGIKIALDKNFARGVEKLILTTVD